MLTGLQILCSEGHPHGTTSFPSALVPNQAYDIYLDLHLPRTPNNLQAGNFMLSLSLLPSLPLASASQRLLPSSITGNHTTIAHARRPAILTYTSPLTDTASTLASLPLYVFRLSKESETLAVSLFEGVEFAKGPANVPSAAELLVEADEKMQFYDVGIRIIAKLSGLRWVLYHHRILSFLVFTTTFWLSSVVTMGIVWLGLSLYMNANSAGVVKKEEESEESDGIVKAEPTPESDETFDRGLLDDLSETSRTFPTIGRQRPLRYPPSRENSETIKREGDGDFADTMIQPLQTTAAEADDEDDFEDEEALGSGWRDSGIGTGVEEGRAAGIQRRRKALLGSGAGR